LSALTICFEHPPTKATLDVIEQGLDAYNANFSPERYSEFAVVLKSEAGEVKGGIYAHEWAGMLFIKWLWIDEAHRRGGHGRALMAAVEAEGRRLGCSAVSLDTFEFQARPFYEKLGYELFGTLDFPAGFKRYFMTKAL
jgi:GNAT superfamily N-acetyltransferase